LLSFRSSGEWKLVRVLRRQAVKQLAELAHRLGLELADALARQVQLSADCLERLWVAVETSRLHFFEIETGNAI
jgi:hypothetical protein